MISEPDRLLTRKQLAQVLGVPERTIRTWDEEHGLPRCAPQNTKPIRYRFGRVIEWLDQSHRNN